ncbi:MAG TPA: S-adenosylmethionine:tRNA ribosyltransferase-isomerase, partial [Lacunisphaera sp.]
MLTPSLKPTALGQVHTDLFDYPLPERLIAQRPAERRDESRLLVVDRQTRTTTHRSFRDLPEYLRAGDTLFRNNAAVIPARLHATRPTGGQVECLLLRPVWSAGDPAREKSQPAAGSPQLQENRSQSAEPGTLHSAPRTPHSDQWWCLLRPGKKLPVGSTFGLEGVFTGTVQEKTDDGLARVSFVTTAGDVLAVANRIGEMPLPPYITGHENPADRTADRDRYQT